MTLEVLTPGLATTFQDLGRHGHQQWGVPVGGPMDEVSHRLANALLGNAPDAPVLEITLLGPTLHCHGRCRLALTGADLGASLNGRPWPPGQTRTLREDDQVSFGRRRSGARAYLAVAGGFRLERVLGSRTTNLRAGFGGWHGRRLQKGDLLPLMGSFANPPRLLIPDNLPHEISAAPLRLVPGRDWTAFTGAAQTALHESPFTVTPQSDRMGYRLQGPTLQLAAPRECLSEAVAFGTVQVPPDGQPIVLMADRQTTGGYPCIAQVAQVDLPRLAQCVPGDVLAFAFIELAEAQRLDLARERLLAALERDASVA